MARRLGDDAEYGLNNGEEEHDSLIELSSNGGDGRRGSSGRQGSTSSVDSTAGASATCRWLSILFALALAGVYHLGLEEGKNEVKKEGDVEEFDESKLYHKDDDNEKPWHNQIFEKAKNALAGGAPGPAPTKVGSFTLERLHATREQATGLIAMLEEYYFSKEQTMNMLLNAWIDPWSFEGGMPPSNKIPSGESVPIVTTTQEKYDRSAKLIDTMARALVTDDQTSFLMGGIGSSVMAGHDNCHYDSYQSREYYISYVLLLLCY